MRVGPSGHAMRPADVAAALASLMHDARRALKPRRLARAVRAAFAHRAAFSRYVADCRSSGAPVPSWSQRMLIGGEATGEMGYEPHYTYHCAWACRVLAETRPPRHVDLSSSLQFAAMASAFTPIEHYDFREPRIVLPGLTVGAADLLSLPFADESISSLSCMHVIEHVGLGRYGDPIDSLGDRRAAAELSRVLRPGGQLLFVAPVGSPRVNFNAHRVYSYEAALGLFPDLTLRRFSLIPDDFRAGMIEGADAETVERQRWGCGCFVFGK